MRVPTLTGATLPISQLATLEFERAPIQIQRYNRERAATINSDVQRGFNTAKVTAEVVKRLDAMSWPRGYHYVLGGEAQSSQEAFGGIGTAIIVAVFGIFAILVLEFGSFKSTLIVLTVVPLGVFGGLVMLLVTGNSISFTAAIGFIALVGIEIKNSILLVDFTNQLREQGVPLDEAIERAGEVRFLPILLTSATAIGGLLPLAAQNIGLYSPMSWVIIGGLISSTLLARLVTPVMYKLIPPEIHVATTTAAAAGYCVRGSPQSPGGSGARSPRGEPGRGPLSRPAIEGVLSLQPVASRGGVSPIGARRPLQHRLHPRRRQLHRLIVINPPTLMVLRPPELRPHRQGDLLAPGLAQVIPRHLVAAVRRGFHKDSPTETAGRGSGSLR